MKATQIKHFPCQLVIIDENGDNHTINYDGTQGEYSREEWLESDEIAIFDKDSQEEILQALEMTYNKPFFKED